MGERATLPFWPRRMKAPMAAAYLGVSVPTFRRRVKAGRYPPGKPDGSNVLWDREVLDRWVDKWSGVKKTPEGPQLDRW